MIRIGLIGCGFMGGMHSACYSALENAQIVAVADVRMEKAEEIAKKHNAKLYSSGEELIKNADIDVIDICLPTYLHTSHAVMAMKQSRDVFIEKPVCMNVEEGKLLLKTEQETGRNVQIGQVIRLWDEYKWLKEITVENKYGKIISAVFTRVSPKPTWGWENWLHKPECSGSMALDLHIHDVDYMRYLMGEPKKTTSKVARNEIGVIEQIFTTFEYDSSVVSVEGCWDYPKDFPFSMSFRVKFEQATAVLDGNGLTVYLNEGGSVKPEIKPEYKGDNEIGGNLSSLGGYYNELKYFIDKLSNNEPLEIAPLSEGIKSVELVLKEIEIAGGVKI